MAAGCAALIANTAPMAPGAGGGAGIYYIRVNLPGGATAAPASRSDVTRALQSNAMSDALPLFESLALDAEQSLALPLSGARHLALRHHRAQRVPSSTP